MEEVRDITIVINIMNISTDIVINIIINIIIIIIIINGMIIINIIILYKSALIIIIISIEKGEEVQMRKVAARRASWRSTEFISANYVTRKALQDLG